MGSIPMSEEESERYLVRFAAGAGKSRRRTFLTWHGDDDCKFDSE
jgi:hypothetical protein